MIELLTPENIALVAGKLEELRLRLLDSTRSNPLIDIKFKPASTSFLRAVDELPDILRHNLASGKEMRLVPLPALDEGLPDEQTDSFRDALFVARQEDEIFLADINKIKPDGSRAEDLVLKAERALKDRLRDTVGLSPRQKKEDISFVEHARLHGISPSYILPLPDEVHDDGRHEDSDIQTLLLPDRLSRTAKAILEKSRSFERETGVNVLHAAFGLLEWKNPEERERFVSPLLLLEVRFDRRQSAKGAEFFIRGEGEVFVNTNLGLKFQSEHHLSLPDYEGGGVEAYFDLIQDVAPSGWHWKVRREVAFGIFPSSKIAMYHDLDPKKKPVAENETIVRLLATTGMGDGSYAETYETDDPEVAAKVPYLVMDADASQYSALVDVAKGSNVAIEGPPGSGKSQTIVNLIAAAMADGKKVLFVAEKLTALDVVRNRLDAAGLGNFILPLQAGRGTTEAVYGSIESRLEMGRSDSRTRDQFQMRQGALERRRAILQAYLNALSAQLGLTGLTVHQVIGHAIATAEIREALPREIRRIPIMRAETLGQNEVEALVNETREFGERLGRVARMPALWRASTAPITSRELAEDQAEAAKGLATSLIDYERGIFASEIAIFHPANPFLADLEAMRRIFSTAIEKRDRINADVLEALLDFGSRRIARDLCGQVQERKTIVARLGHDLRDPEGWNIDGRLKNAAEFAAAQGATLEPEKHRNQAAAIMAKIAKANSLFAAADRLPKSWTGSGRALTEIHSSAKLIASQPQDVLGLRRADPLRTVAKVALEIGTELSRLATEIGGIRQALPSAGGSHSPNELRNQAVTLDEAGLFGRMGSSFKAARSTYTNILGGRRDDERTEMARRMREYASWLETRDLFESNGQFKERFGEHFNGVNTDLSAIHRVVAFHETCEAISGGSSDLKHQLETGDLSSVIAFAEMNLVSSLNLSALTSHLQSLASQFEAENRLITEAESHIEIFLDKTSLSHTEIEANLRRKTAEADLRKKIEESPAREILGNRFAGLETQIDVLAMECDLAEAISATGFGDIVIGVIRSGRAGEISREFDVFATQRARIAKQVTMLVADLGLPENMASAADLMGKISDLRTAAADPASLLARAQLKRAEDSLRAQGLADLIDWAIGQGDAFAAGTLAPIVRALIARSMADIAYQKYGETLQGYDGQDFDAIREEIASKDRELISMSKRVIANELLRVASPPSGNNIGRKSSFTEMSLIYNEMHKKKRRIGIRDLTKRAGRALLELKPCWMMSPLAVAQYLHDGMHFDLVVIDEASQMTPENAVGAISRADQAVIVGDTKQLPPTSFFQKLIDDSDTDEDLREDSESILDMANVAFMPVRQLRWHYRSRHSALIQFSNQWMYKGELTIFPSAQEDHPDLGVELVEIPGIYKGRRNEVEARAVVAAVLHHMAHRPNLSLGICTMNSDQKDLILEEFERERDRNPNVQAFVADWEVRSDGLEEFFIKNIETIQGDERDVIFISTLYGPETLGGKVHQRFGPINSAQGHRRLNVLFTRAKRKIVTFTSMKPTDILVDGAKNLGVRMFQAWLEYSRTGHIADTAERRSSTESPFEDYVAVQAERLGCEVVPQVGVAGYRIDLGLRHSDWPYGYILGIECDGAAYHSSRSSRDRDRLRQQVLEGLGWRLHRIWSTDWFRNPRQEIEVLKEVIDASLAIAKANGINHTEKLDPMAFLSQSVVDRSSDLADGNKIAERPDRHTSEQQSKPEQGNLSFDLPPQGKLPAATSGTQSEPTVVLGSKVKVENISDGGHKLTFVLIEGSNDPDNGKIGVHTPLGRALIDAQVGDEVEFQVGSRIKEVRVLEIR